MDIIKRFTEKNTTNRSMLSNSFNMICEKIEFADKSSYVAKYYNKKNSSFNSILSEGESLKYMYKKFPNLFPKIEYLDSELLVIEYINHNGIKKKNYQLILAEKIISIHSNKFEQYGFHIDSQIGGLRQPSDFDNNWINFFSVYCSFSAIR